MNLNKGIYILIVILIIIVVAAVVGVLVWQVTKPTGQPTSKQASDYTTQSACEEAGYYWYDNSCHKEKQSVANGNEATWNCGDVVSYKGQDYDTVKIGEQCWFAENLNVGTKIKGQKSQSDNGVVEKYCYDDESVNCATYGGLYQWDEAMQYSRKKGNQGICPNGWHIPKDGEWYTLESYLASEACEKNRKVLSSSDCKPAGAKMAGKSSLWNDYKVTITSQPQFGGSRLNILPAGGWANYEQPNSAVAYSHDGFYNKGYSTLLWTSNKKEAEVLLRYLFGKQSGLSRVRADKTYGYSVRCIRN